MINVSNPRAFGLDPSVNGYVLKKNYSHVPMVIQSLVEEVEKVWPSQ